MVYQIDPDIRAARSGGLHFEVSYWNNEASRLAGDPPVYREDFEITTTVRRSIVVRPEDGWLLLADGSTYVNPALIAHPIDLRLYTLEDALRPRMQALIVRQWKLFAARRAAGRPLPADNRMPTQRRDAQTYIGSDPENYLTVEVQAERGVVREVLNP